MPRAEQTEKTRQVQAALDAKYGKGKITITRHEARPGFHGVSYHVTGEPVDRVAPNRAHYDPKGITLEATGANTVAVFLAEVEAVVAHAKAEELSDLLDTQHREYGHAEPTRDCRECAKEARQARARAALGEGRLAYALDRARTVVTDLESIASDVRREIASFEARPLDDPVYGSSYIENMVVQIYERVQQGVTNLRLGTLIQAAAAAGRETDRLRAEQREEVATGSTLG